MRINEEIASHTLNVLLAITEIGSVSKAVEAQGVRTVSLHRTLHTRETGLHDALFRDEGRHLIHPSSRH